VLSVTVNNNYKARLLKVKSARQKKDPNDIQSILDMIGKTMLKITALDNSAWTDQEKESFCETLAGFKAEIESRLAETVSKI
jgi:hypothetical protein